MIPIGEGGVWITPNGDRPYFAYLELPEEYRQPLYPEAANSLTAAE